MNQTIDFQSLELSASKFSSFWKAGDRVSGMHRLKRWLIQSLGIAATLGIAARADTIQNGPITPASVELNGVATASALPDGTILGEPGIVLRRLAPDEEPSRVIAIASSRLSNGGIVRWDVYLENFKLGFYPLTDYTNSLPPLFTIALPRAVDVSNNIIGTVDAGNGSVMPNTPAFTNLLSTTNLLTRYGYWLGFNLTTKTQEVNATTAYVPPTLVGLMRTTDVVMTFWTISNFANDGGTRIGAQEPGFGQEDGLNVSVFKSDIQSPTLFEDLTFSYALELRTKTSFVPSGIAAGGGRRTAS